MVSSSLLKTRWDLESMPESAVERRESVVVNADLTANTAFIIANDLSMIVLVDWTTAFVSCTPR